MKSETEVPSELPGIPLGGVYFSHVKTPPFSGDIVGYTLW